MVLLERWLGPSNSYLRAPEEGPVRRRQLAEEGAQVALASGSSAAIACLFAGPPADETWVAPSSPPGTTAFAAVGPRAPLHTADAGRSWTRRVAVGGN